MEDDLKRLLEQKKVELKIRQKRAAMQQLKERLIQDIERFHEKYRYVDEVEAEKIQDFISKLDFARPGQLNIKTNSGWIHDTVYLCFLMGSKELLEIYIFGKYDDIISDYDEWEIFSPYLLLIDEDFNHYVYIDEDGQMMESQILLNYIHQTDRLTDV